MDREPLRLLFVCDGNVCRSPAAELLLRAHVDAGVVRPESAGLRALVGEPVARHTARQLSAAGVDATSFRSRALTTAMLEAAGLVVTMTAEQRSAVVVRAPAVMRRTWTLLDLSRTVEDSGLSMTGDLDDLLAARAGSAGDVLDPWGRGRLAHRRAFGQVSTAVARLAAAAV